MSQENVDWWWRTIEAWSRGDRDALLKEITDDWEFHTSGVFPGLRPVYRGISGAADLWNDMRGPWKTFRIEVDRVEDLGDKLVGLVRFTVEGRDGLKTTRRWAYVVGFRDGIPTRTDNFATWNEALEAVGLEE